MSDQAEDPMPELLRAVSTLSYAMGRAQVHTRLMAAGGVELERAAVALLRVLRAADGPLRVSDLAGLLLVRPPHVTRQVGQLEAQGLVERTRDTDDHRVQRVGLTAAGRTEIDRFLTGVREQLREVLAGEPPADIRTASRIITKLAGDLGVGAAPVG